MRRIFFLLAVLISLFSFRSLIAQNTTPPPNAVDIRSSQTVDGITMTIYWAYADADTVEVQYSVTPPSSRTEMQQFARGTRITLYGAGRIGQSLIPQYDTELGTWLGARSLEGNVTRQWVQAAGFPLTNAETAHRYISLDQPLPESLDLALEFVYTPPELRENNTQPAPEVTAEPEAPNASTEVTIETTPMPEVQPTRMIFNFSVPLTPPQVIEVNQQVSIDGDMSLTLERMLVNRHTLGLEFCNTLDNAWYIETAQIWLETSQYGYLTWDDPATECDVVTAPIVTGQPPANVRVEIFTLARGAGFIDTLEEWRTLEPFLNRDNIYLDIVFNDELPQGFRIAGYLDENGIPIPRNLAGILPTFELEDYVLESGMLERVRGKWDFSTTIPNGRAEPYASMGIPPELIARATEQSNMTPVVPTPIPAIQLTDYNIAYLVNPDAVSPDTPAQDPALLEAAVGAQTFTTWADFTAASQGQTWHVVFIHESALDWADAATITAIRADGAFIAGFNTPPEKLAALTGSESHQMNLPEIYEGYYLVVTNRTRTPYYAGPMEAKGDVSGLQGHLLARFLNLPL